MPKPGVASARALMRLVDELAVAAFREGRSVDDIERDECNKHGDMRNTLRAEIASRLRRMERGEG